MSDLDLPFPEAIPYKTKGKLKSEKLADENHARSLGIYKRSNIWTSNKAQIIARYIYTFLSVTKNVIYIDAFSGRQDEADNEESWTAKNILEKRSVFLRKVYLFEQDARKIPPLQILADDFKPTKAAKNQPKIFVHHGDCNQEIPKVFDSEGNKIRPRQAAFALLDQRTTECSWDLVKYLANLKQPSDVSHRVEILYFLAQGWLNRALKTRTTASKNAETRAWWGDDTWVELLKLKPERRARYLVERFQSLGYKFAQAYGMRDKNGKEMFYLIHATDHELAPSLMAKAYQSTCKHLSDEEFEKQFDL